MDSEQNKEKQPHWIDRYNIEKHMLDLGNYELKISQDEFKG